MYICAYALDASHFQKRKDNSNPQQFIHHKACLSGIPPAHRSVLSHGWVQLFLTRTTQNPSAGYQLQQDEQFTAAFLLYPKSNNHTASNNAIQNTDDHGLTHI